MKIHRSLFILSSVLTFTLSTSLSYAASQSINTAPNVIIKPHPVELNAASWVLMDFETGDVIAQKNDNEKRAPASLTKIMTAYIVASELKQGTLKLDQKVPISAKAAKTPGSKMFVREGSQVSVNDLLHGMIVQSGNDASVALAEFIAGSDNNFVTLMNKVAKALGMDNTHFVTVDGLPGENQHTTALDMAKLARAFIAHYPKVYQLYSQKTFTYNEIIQHNRNKLLSAFPGADGIKTGYTQKAGYNLVGSAVQNNQRFISVIMGAPSATVRLNESIKLLNFGFGRFEDVTLYQKGQRFPLKDTVIPDAKKSSYLTVTVNSTLIKTIPKSFTSHLQHKITLKQGLKAPIKKGDEVGTLIISAGDNQVAKIAVYADNNVDKIGFFSKWFG
ncbi:D-alanyl-D-alanine carboxypeptidase family protein [Fangia hongkongensis]|uniref:D-alanyl-D-alanine carboxypeptidase family protein n=1 Tax=Fangia hongkongensis TaxID=270495 RepID=UPI00054E340F|nr:D-alanyl-D-alanine carboxypeptidase family protein [Fangia hongkongensis]